MDKRASVQPGDDVRVDEWRVAHTNGPSAIRPDTKEEVRIVNYDRRGKEFEATSSDGDGVGKVRYDERGFIVLSALVEVFLPDKDLYATRKEHFQIADDLLRTALTTDPTLKGKYDLSD
jgi:hypothetical protein